jgi:hypothetical protein
MLVNNADLQVLHYIAEKSRVQNSIEPLTF